MQVGSDEVFEQFQSGWSGATYDAETAGGKQVLARMLTNAGKTALTGSYAKRQQKEALRRAWLTQLVGMAAQVLAVYPDNGTSQGENRIREMYCLMAERQIDYPESKNNTQALRALLELVQEARQQNLDPAQTPDWLAAQADARGYKLPERKERTQLDAMVAYLAATAQAQGMRRCHLSGSNRCLPTCRCNACPAGPVPTLPKAAGPRTIAFGNWRPTSV